MLGISLTVSGACFTFIEFSLWYSHQYVTVDGNKTDRNDTMLAMRVQFPRTDLN